MEQIRRAGDRSNGGVSLLERALLGRDDRRQREQRAVADRYDELLHWGRSRRERQDHLVARLDNALAALAEAEGRLGFFEHSRLVRAAAKAARLGRRGPSPGDARSARGEPERRASAVRDTGLFDDDFYRTANADVASGTGDPASHFAETGWWEGRWPNARFDPAFYLATNPDVAEAGDNPLVHYAEQGILEGRRPSAPERVARWVRPPHEALHADDEAAVEAVLDTGLFDERFYREAHPDVVLSGLEPVLHFALDGWKEGRRPNAHFDPAFYLDANPDVAASGENPLVHYATVGIFEGRAPSREAASSHASSVTPEEAMAEALLDTGLFDAKFYRTAYPDVPSSSTAAALHFAMHGWKEGRKPNAEFDPAFYLARNPDVAALGVNPVLHFAEHGLLEGRPFSALAASPGVFDGPTDAYGRWVEQHDTLGEGDRRAIRARVLRLRRRPLISVVMPVYNPQVGFLRQAVASVQSQIYPDWELCIADDAS
ncbi:glycosyltransferase, partial [Lichenibacterium minor]